MTRPCPHRQNHRSRHGWTKFQAVVVVAAVAAGGAWLGRGMLVTGLDPVPIQGARKLDREVVSLVEEQIAVVRREPRDALAHGRLGMIYEAANLWEEAQLSYANAAQLAPSDARWRYHRAYCLFETGATEEATVLLEEAAPELQTEAAPQHRLGIERLRAGDVSGAQSAFELARRLAPGRPQPKVGLAEVAIERGDYSKAIGLLESVLEGEPDYKQAHYLLGLAYRGEGRTAEAERELTLGTDASRRYMADSLSPEMNRYRVNQTVIVDRAVDLIERKEFARGASMLEGVRERRPDDLYVLNMLGSAYVGMDEYEKARMVLLEVLARDPEPVAALINLSDCFIRENKLAQGLQYAERAVSIAPGIAAAQFNRGRALLAMRAHEEAYAAFQETIRADGQYSQAHVALGEVCCLLNRVEEGIEHFKTGVRLDPQQLRAVATLAGLLMSAQRFDEARPYVERAEELAPDEPRVQQLRQRLDQRR